MTAFRTAKRCCASCCGWSLHASSRGSGSCCWARVGARGCSAACCAIRRSREFNSQTDVVTKEVGRSADAVLDIVDSFARLDIGHPLARVLGVAITNVGLLQALVASQLFRTKPPTRTNPPT